jgi:hypothetical protein
VAEFGHGGKDGEPRTMMNTQALPEQPPALTSATTAPPLWNPNAAGCWSILFTPAFGAYLHAQNAKSLGRDIEAKGNLTTFYLNLAYVVFVLVSIFIPSIPQPVFTGVSIALLFSWYFSFCKKQAQYVKATYGDNYPRKPWGMPLLIGFACLIVFFAIVFGLELIANPESRPQ